MNPTVATFALRISFLACLLAWSPADADDWPQWNGPTRDGVLYESGIVGKIPADGLPKVWEQPIRPGYSGPAVAQGRVFITDYQKTSGRVENNPGSRDQLTGKERILCFDAVTGEPLWKHEYNRPYAVSYGNGPRVTPTVSDGLVYSLGAEGNLICLNTETGDVIWQKDFRRDYSAETPLWGHSAAPLVHNDLLICLVGGDGSLVVAFDRQTGDERWKALSAADTGYCSPSVIQAGGTEQLLIWDPETLHSLNPKNGREYWRHPLKPGYGMSIHPPVIDGNLLFASGEGDVSAMFQLSKNAPRADVLWRGNVRTSLYLATSAAIFDDGYLYGSDAGSGALICARATDGKRMWQTTKPTSGGDNRKGVSHGSAFLIKAQDGYLILSDTGDFISARLTPDAYEETGRFHAIEPTEDMRRRKVVWSFPAVSEGRLYLRNGKSLVAWNLRAENTR